MSRKVLARRFIGEQRVGLWPREFKEGTSITYPDSPWVASISGEERVFPTFRSAVDFLYFECRRTTYEEPVTGEFEYDHGPG